MTGDKTQPQELLESILPIETRNESEKYPSDPEPMPGSLVTPEKWPSIAEQQKHWADKEKAAEPIPPRKWSLARRRKYNATMKRKLMDQSPEINHEALQQAVDKYEGPHLEAPREKVPAIRYCPHCGESIERFLS